MLEDFYVVEFDEAESDQDAAECYGIAVGFYEGHYDTRPMSDPELGMHGLDGRLRGWYEISGDDRLMIVRVFESDDGWMVERF